MPLAETLVDLLLQHRRHIDVFTLEMFATIWLDGRASYTQASCRMCYHFRTMNLRQPSFTPGVVPSFVLVCEVSVIGSRLLVAVCM